MKRTLNPLKHYTSLCDQAQINNAHVELWTDHTSHELQTLRVVTTKRTHTTPIVAHDIEEAAKRILNKNIFP